MRVAVLSDLHIGCPPVRGAFGHPPAAFDAWLGQLLDSHDHVVLNGDVFQADHQLRWGRGSETAAVRRALNHHPWLRARLDDPRVRLLRGNHDDVTAELLGAGRVATFSGAAGALVVTHGDHADPLIGQAPGISALATWTSGRLRRLGLHGLSTWLEGRDISLKGARFGGVEGPYALAASALLREHDAQVVVFGHTHIACLQVLQDGIYANPGSASLGRKAWLSVDLGEGRLRVMRGAAVEAQTGWAP